MEQGIRSAARRYPEPRVFVCLLAALLFGLTMPEVVAQGCAMCSTAVQSQGEQVVRSLGLGVLVLLVPPLGIVATILYVTFRRNEV